MAKYFVSTRAGLIIEADSADAAKDIYHSIAWEIEDGYTMIFDTVNETVAKELFD